MQPLVVPDDSPWRTAASHELLRTDPFHVNVSVCALVTPLLVPLICPVALWLKGTSASPPPLPIEPGSVRLSVPDVSGKAVANLEVESIQHKAPMFHGDTLYAETKVLDKEDSQSKPDRG